MTSDHRIRVFTVDDHPLVRQGIGAMIKPAGHAARRGSG